MSRGVTRHLLSLLMADLLFLDTRLINIVLDKWFRRCCCRPFSLCGLRPNFPSDPWFVPVELSHYCILRKPDGERFDHAFVETQITLAAGRVEPRLCPWLVCTRDALLCGLIPTNDEARFGFFVVRNATVDPGTGRAHLWVWGEYLDKAEAAMRDLKDQCGRKIPTQAIERGAPVAANVTLTKTEVTTTSGAHVTSNMSAAEVPLARPIDNFD